VSLAQTIRKIVREEMRNEVSPIERFRVVGVGPARLESIHRDQVLAEDDPDVRITGATVDLEEGAAVYVAKDRGGDYVVIGRSPRIFTDVEYATAELEPDERESGTVTLGAPYPPRADHVRASAAARVRLYTSTAARDADQERGIWEEPPAGVLLDVVLGWEELELDLSPPALANPGPIPIIVDNLSGVPLAISVYFSGVG